MKKKEKKVKVINIISGKIDKVEQSELDKMLREHKVHYHHSKCEFCYTRTSEKSQ